MITAVSLFAGVGGFDLALTAGQMDKLIQTDTSKWATR